MAMTTNSAAGAGVGAAEQTFSLGSLYHRLRYIEIATGENDASPILWPCLEFEDYSLITPDVKKAINMSAHEGMALLLSTVKRVSSKQGMQGQVALLLGKTVPNQNRCVWFQGELLSFMDNFMLSVQSGEDADGLADAMHLTESMIEAAMSTEGSTTAVAQSDANVSLDAPPSNKSAAVENPPEQGNAVEAKSTAPKTNSSNDAEAIAPQKASVESMSKVEEAVAPKEASIKSERDVVQTRKTRASSSKEVEAIAPTELSMKPKQKIVPLTTKTRASSSRKRPKTAKAARVSMDATLTAEEMPQSEQDSLMADSSATSNEGEAIAPTEPSIEPKQKVVPLTTKTRASSRKRPKTAKAARVSMDAALTAEDALTAGETPPPEQDSPMADSSTTSSTQTRQTKHSFGLKRKALPSVAVGGKKQATPSTQSKKAKTIVLSEIVIPSFEEVRKSLNKGGFVFRDSIYCRPGMDPAKNKESQVGEGYFKDEQSFRKHLCAYGVDGDCDKWTEDDETLIEKWVRYTVVKSVSGECDIPEKELWSGTRAMNFLLNKLDFRSCNLQGLTKVIVLPGVSKGQEIVGVNCFFDSQRGIWSHLARFGIPDNCYLSGVSNMDMLKLELYVCCNDKIETFGNLQGPDNVASPGSSPSHSNVSIGGRPTRSLRKRPVVDDNATTITADSVGVGTEKTLEKQPNTGKDKKKKGRPAKATAASSTKQSTKLRVSTQAISSASQSPIERQLFGPLSPKIEVETSPLPEIEGTAEEKLTASLDALKMTNQAENNSFYRSGTHFASNLKTILKFLSASIESKGGHGGKEGEPAALYVCGVPGIGKTSGVRWCCTKAIEETMSNNEYEGPIPTVVHINAGHLSSASKPEEILLEEFARALVMNKPENQKKNNILKHIRKNMILVVVDEIDLLVSESSQTPEGRLPGTEGVIQTLFGFARDETMPIALIGISNSSANNKYFRLNEIGKFKDTVTFKTYSKDDLVGIVQARIGNKIVAPSALEFIAKKVEQNTGDARSALEMTVKAIERRLSAVRDGCKLPSDHHAPLVTMADVMPAVKKSNTKIAETIEGLPAMGKAILCVLTTLARTGAKSTTLGKLKRFTSDAMLSDSQQEEVLTLDDFKALIETLTDTGLLSVGGSMHATMGMGNLQMLPVSLDLQLEDVELAIANGLGKERFYENLCEFTKKNADLL